MAPIGECLRTESSDKRNKANKRSRTRRNVETSSSMGMNDEEGQRKGSCWLDEAGKKRVIDYM